MLRESLKRGVPALLSDITNCIRHGDICLLGGSDPVLIEVKTSGNTNARTERQVSNIAAIQNYLVTDEAVDTRGASHLIRVALSIPEVNYRHLLDQGIEDALVTGLHVADPERGLKLIISSSNSALDLDSLFSRFRPSALFFFNALKNENGWGVYFPYTLSIRSPRNLYAFLDGRVHIVVAFDFEALKTVARSRGLDLSISTDETFPLQIDWIHNKSNEPSFSRWSTHFVGRFACELLSWKWAFSEERRRFITVGVETLGSNPPGSDRQVP